MAAARPDWGVVLVYQRMHGDSQQFAPPHTVAATAEDLLALDAVTPGPIPGVYGTLSPEWSFARQASIRAATYCPRAMPSVLAWPSRTSPSWVSSSG